ncbi:MAG: U32 family peptidase [Selenomonadaceae bacterium]|nr:U32 family peptidase [Selenomonadaceae bacterium]
MKRIELLSPAGNFEKMQFALEFGADAVYLGGKNFGLRAFSGNFTDEEISRAVEYAHSKSKSVYVTVNIFPHESDLKTLPDFLKHLDRAGVDGLLVADLGIFSMAREIVPNLKLHVSTQANITNSKSARAWQNLGATRLVLARELSLDEIKKIRDAVDCEIEVFVHGAMCLSYSGRCYLSAYMTNRDANRGSCTQPCRWKYSLVEEKRPNEFFPIDEDERGTFILNSKDLCLLPRLKDLLDVGIDSLKIEGRMKSVNYVAGVTKIYRQAIDSYISDAQNFSIDPEWIHELGKISHRPYTTGFTFDDGESMQVYDSSSYVRDTDFLGIVRSYENGIATIEHRNRFERGETIEFFQPNRKSFNQRIDEIFDEDGNRIEVANRVQQILKIPIENPVDEFTILRRI